MSVTLADGVLLTAEIGFSTAAGSGTVPINSTLASITYTDVSTYVRSVQIKRGRSSELDDFTTGSCQVLLDNRTRIFDPEQIPYVYLPGTSGNYVSTPDAAVLDITGDIDIAVRVAMTDWTPASGGVQTLIGKRLSPSNLSYNFSVRDGANAGKLLLQTTANGSTDRNATSSVAPTVSDGEALWVRATRASSSGSTVFYTAPDSPTYPTVWTQLGTTISTTAGAIFAGTANLVVGSQSAGTSTMLNGTVYRAIVKNGIDGTTVADFDATKFQTAASTTCVAETGETWTLNTSGTGTVLVAGPYYGTLTPGRPIRIQATAPGGSAETIFQGYVDQWDQQYTNPSDAVAMVTASDAFKVLNLITLPSYWEYQIRKDLGTKPGADAWFRFDDGDAPTNPFETITGQSVGSWKTTAGAATTGASTGSLVANDSSVSAVLDGTDFIEIPFGFLRFNSFSYLEKTVQCWISTSTTTDGEYGIFYKPGNETTIALGMVVSGGVGTIQGQWGSIAGINQSYAETSTITVNDGKPHHLVLRWDWNTSAHELYVDGVLATTSTSFINSSPTETEIVVGKAFTSSATATYNMTSAFVGTIDELVFYTDFGLTATQIAEFYAIGKGTYLSGNTASQRLDSLLAMADWMSDGETFSTATSTVQGIDTQNDTLLSALKECEKADQGRLFCDRSGLIKFISHDSMATTSTFNTSQRTFGDGTGELPYLDLEFNYNDQLIFNRSIASRQNGATVTVNDTTSQGQYFIRTDSQSGLINDTDQAMTDIANVRIATYKQPQLRIEQMRFSPRRLTSMYSATITDDIGTRITVKRRPQGVGSVISKELIVEGISHDIGISSWETTYNLSPAPLAFFILDSSTFGVLDTNLLGY